MTRLSVAWTVIELWTLSAEDLLAFNDVGVVPWVPLAQTTLPPEELVRRCRERIEQQGKAEEQESLLAVTRVMTNLRYNSPRLAILLGGRSMSWFNDVLDAMELPNLQVLVRDMPECEIKEFAKQHLKERMVREGLEHEAIRREELGWALQEFLTKSTKEMTDNFQTTIVEILQRKFTEVPEEVITKIRTLQDVPLLRKLTIEAGTCPTLDAFRAQLPS